MKIINPALALALIPLLCGCSAVMSDSKIEQRLVGAWTEPHTNIQSVVTYCPNGIWVQVATPIKYGITGNFSFILDGAWKVKDGIIIKTTSERTQERFPDSEFGVEHLKVIRINDDLLTLCESGETNVFTLKKL